MNRTGPDWNLYRTFLALLDEGSLSGAARALGLTQPTVGRHLDALEAAIGRRLFLRSPHGLVPTETAAAIRAEAEGLAASAAALWRSASAEAGAIAGRVRIATSEVMAVEVLPPILAAIRRRHPGLDLEIVASSRVEDLLRREADVAVRMVAPRQEGLVARRLGQVGLGLFAHRDHLAREGTPTSYAELAAATVIGFDRQTAVIRALAVRMPELTRIDFALRSDSDLVQLAAIRAGYGIGACQVAIAARDPALVRVLPDLFAPSLDCWLVIHENLRGTPRVRAVFDGLAEGLAGHVDR
ncbi:LysR family transcriptional regulator [Siculibacillus lacustris]|uniref:LysR family transcriptional regulator n=1 Tax=Siculibacillus lacustris TaxID=1549641 RepID=A0A4Q9VP92_9HYPH|nr:LysR family transcriptional regulator [Siculibacillus lacustris]TBW36622.1 LysR family transcriptional regulator [Siculibacillus lacustris]